MLAAAERHAVAAIRRRIRVCIRARDLDAALAEADRLDVLAAPPSPRRPALPTAQLALILPAVALADPFTCPRLRGVMTIEDCLVRRTRTWPSGGGKGSPAPEAMVCVGCETGSGWAVQLPNFKPPPSTMAPAVLPNSQRMAKQARALVGLGDDEVVRVDPMAEAATLTPDDKTDWRT